MTRDVPPLESSRNIANTLRPLSRESSQQEIQSVPGEALISLRDIHVGFEDREVLQGISFDVAHGETKVLLGETGTGKTLIMKLAAGLIRPDSGHVLVMGHDVSEMPERELLNFRRSIGFVFQEGALFDSMTVADNVSFRLREEAMDETEIDARVREALRFVEMADALEKFPADLSGGMRRRVSIARALVATHRVQDAFGLANFCFDKASGRVRPLLGNGDQGVARSLAEREKAAESGKERNQKQPTNVLVLRDGKIYFEAPADELLRTKDEYLKKFLASAE